MNIERHVRQALDKDFDPCQPCAHIPIVRLDQSIPAPTCRTLVGGKRVLPELDSAKPAVSKIKFISDEEIKIAAAKKRKSA